MDNKAQRANRYLAVKVAVVALLVSSLWAHSAAADPGPPTPPPNVPDQAAAALLALEENSAAAAEKAFKSGAIDVGSNGKGGPLVALFPQDTPEQSTVAARNAGVQIKRLPLTRAQYGQFERLMNERNWTPGVSRYAYSFGGDADSGRILLSTTAPPDATDVLEKRFPGALLIERETRLGRASRFTDGAPHWGGAIIASPAGGSLFHYCTSGMTVRASSGTRYMVTAGHCGALGSTWSSPGNGQLFGYMNHRRPFPQYDLAMLSGSTYTNGIYVGNTTGTYSAVISAGNPGIGGSYCHSGGFSGSVCGHVMQSLNSTFCDADGCTSGLQRSTGGASVLDGDSGGPFYATAGSSAMIRGMIVASSPAYLYTHAWGTIAAQFGVSILTSP